MVALPLGLSCPIDKVTEVIGNEKVRVVIASARHLVNIDLESARHSSVVSRLLTVQYRSHAAVTLAVGYIDHRDRYS